MNIGRVGIWSMALEAQPLSVAQEAAAELDELGFPALWVPEALGKEVMSHAALLLAATRRMVVATGIANLWARDATAMVNAQRTLTEGFPERFLLGIGVSHTPTVALRGHTLVRPSRPPVTTSPRWMPPATSVPFRLPRCAGCWRLSGRACSPSPPS